MGVLKDIIYSLVVIVILFMWVIFIFPFTQHLWGSVLCILGEGWIFLLGVNIIPKRLMTNTQEQKDSFPVITKKVFVYFNLFCMVLGVMAYFMMQN